MATWQATAVAWLTLAGWVVVGASAAVLLVWQWRRVWWLTWRLALVAVALALLLFTRKGAGWLLRRVVPRSSAPGRQEGKGNADRGSGNGTSAAGQVPLAKIKPVSAQRVATAKAETVRYGVHAVKGPGLVTMLCGASGMGKSEWEVGTLAAQFWGEALCGLDTVRGGKKLYLTEMSRGQMREILRRWGLLVEPHGLLDRVRLNVWPGKDNPGGYLDIEYADAVFTPDPETGEVTDWQRVLLKLCAQRAGRKYDEITVDTLGEWMGSDNNDHIGPALGLCRQLTKDGAGVNVLHHTPLSDPTRPKGGMGVLRNLDMGWALYGVGANYQKRSLKDPERYLACFKSRYQEDVPGDGKYRIVYEPADPDAGRSRPHYRLATTTEAPTTERPERPEAPEPTLTERQQRVYQTLRATPAGAATTPDLSAATGLDADRVRETLKALARLGLVLPAGMAAPHARGSKPAARWRAVEAAEAVPVADRLLHEALDAQASEDVTPPSHRGAGGLV